MRANDSVLEPGRCCGERGENTGREKAAIVETSRGSVHTWVASTALLGCLARHCQLYRILCWRLYRSRESDDIKGGPLETDPGGWVLAG